MHRAVARLPSLPDLALVDGNQPPRAALPGALRDRRRRACLSIAAASIVAKVVRDRAMARLSARFPQYGWQTNAGYWHPAAPGRHHPHGPSRHHRPTFGAVRLHIAGRDERVTGVAD